MAGRATLVESSVRLTIAQLAHHELRHECESAPNRDPARDWTYHVDLMPIISVLVGSRSAPIGTPRLPEFSTVNEYASPNSMGIPLRC
jgi:hypothetical protein